MKHLLKRSMAMVLTLLLVISLLPGVIFTADAATVNYQTAYVSSKYPNVIKNWGTREVVATFLSPNAEKFYQDTTYEELAALSGSSSLTAVDTSALYVALYGLMAKAHGNKTSYDDTRDMYQYTDCQGNGTVSTKISAFYSGEEVGPAWDSGKTWNREHVWPNSKGGDGKNEDDIMMLRPETQSNNSSRGNAAFGESGGYYNPESKFTNDYDVRGDIARIVLYTYVRWGTEEQEVLNNIWGTDGVIESKAILLKWMQADPVDTWEMGRNDSVQSITGTRNVFVDYPELAFMLFNEPVPQMSTPSGNAGSAAYTITAKSNNTAYGTVSVSGNVITAVPANGYYVSGYNVTSGSATVSQNGNVFTVKATADCAITINFAIAPKHTVQIKENGVIKSSASIQANTAYTLPGFSSVLPENHTFLGWSAAEISGSGQKPAVYAAGEKVTISANTVFHAVVAVYDPNVVGGTKTWNLVTSNSQIAVGSEVIIAAKDSDYAMSTTQNSNNRGQAAVSKNGSALTFETSAGVQIFTLAAGNISGSYAFYTGSGYLYAINNTSNYLRTQTSKSDAASFNIAAESDGTSKITSAQYVSGTANVGNVPMQYNTQGMFACYPKATQKTLSLYVAQSSQGATTYTTSWSGGNEDCTHPNTTTVTIPATCTADGSETVSCTACGAVVSSKVLPAGHDYRYEVIQPTLSQWGYTLEYCALCGDETTEDDVPPLTNVESWNLSLGSDLSMNFKVNVDASIRSTAQIHIAVAKDAKVYNVSDLSVASDGCYYLPVKLAAIQMTDAVTVQIVNGADMTQKKTYSVRAYADAILAGEYEDTTKALVTQMLHYGAAAQIYFNYNVSNLANAGLDAAAQTAPQTSNLYTVTGTVEGLDFCGATLSFRDRVALRYYFTVAGDISDYTFKVNGNTCTAVQKGDRYYIEIADINPQDLDSTFTVQVNDALTVTYSPMNYVVNMHRKGSAELQALVYALYNYHLAAVDYLA